MIADDSTLYTTGESIKPIKESLQLCLDRVSMWCTANHMLINPVIIQSMLIDYTAPKTSASRSVTETVTGRSKHWTSSRISLIRYHCRTQTSMTSPGGLYMQNNFKTHINSLSAATVHQHRHQNNSLQRGHETSRWLYYVSNEWDGCGEVHT